MVEWTLVATPWKGNLLLVNTAAQKKTIRHFSFTESLSTGTVTFKESGVVVTGGYDNSNRLTSTELFPSSCYIPDLPIVRTAHVTFLHHFSSHSEPRLVTCGGLVGPRGVLDGGCCNSNDVTNECLVLDMMTATWETTVVGSLNQGRWRASAVSMPVGVYVIGGSGST